MAAMSTSMGTFIYRLHKLHSLCARLICNHFGSIKTVDGQELTKWDLRWVL